MDLAASNLLCVALGEFMKNKTEWKGLPSELLEKLNIIATKSHLGRNSKYWPDNAISLGIRLRKISPLLKEIGIDLDFKGHGRVGRQIGSVMTIVKRTKL